MVVVADLHMSSPVKVGMKRTVALILGLLLPVGAAMAGDAVPAAGAGPPVAEADQIYFEATITKDGQPVTRPNALVRAGSTAQLSLGRKSATGPRLGLRYVVPAAGEAGTPVTISGLLDGREVVTAPLDVIAAAGAEVTLDGGGYTWQVHAARISPALIRKRLGLAP